MKTKSKQKFKKLTEYDELEPVELEALELEDLDIEGLVRYDGTIETEE